MKTNSLGIYIHVPYCLRKCIYCGFFSCAHVPDENEQNTYAASIERELEKAAEEFGIRRVDTVFFGGGTPTVLKAAILSRLLAAVKRAFDVAADAEITTESNPGTLTERDLTVLREAGFNRLSIGCQSFDDTVLKALGRIHTAEEALEAYRAARRCGFGNINLDLMFAVPGHTPEIWEDTLYRVTDLKPEHISAYSLQMEEDTPLFDMLQRGEIEEVSDESDRLMYHRAVSLLKPAGYDHYEISNFSLPGYECRHNLKYWSMGEYLGFGPSASSFAGGIRVTNAPRGERHVNTVFDSMSEFVFTGLRKADGISYRDFREMFGRDLWDAFADRRAAAERFIRTGALIDDGKRLRLSEYGIDISNKVMAEFV